MRSMICAFGAPAGAACDLLALDLHVDQVAGALAHGVLVGLGLKLVRGDLLDELHGELQLRLLDLRRRDRAPRRRPELVGVAELLHDQAFLEGAEEDQVVLAAGGVARQRRAAGLPHGLGEQPVGLVAPLVGAEIGGLLEVDRIDLIQGHELGDLDRVRRLRGQSLQLLVREQHILPLGVLVTFDHILPTDDLVVGGQMYCCFSREPHFLCSMLNWMPAALSPVE